MNFRKTIAGASVLFVMAFAMPALAADIDLTLYSGVNPLIMGINSMGNNIYEVHGVYKGGKTIAVSGTAVVEGSTARFGLILGNAMDGYAPVSWEFVLSLTNLAGTGNFQWLTNGETTGTLTITPTKTKALSPEEESKTIGK